MAPLNPSTEVEPNFAGESWEAARDGIISGGKTAEEAIEILTQSWRAQHERNLVAWNEHLQQQQQAPGPNGGNGGNPPITPPGNAADEAPEWLNEPTPSFLDIQPARHILKRLEKKEYIELWHFTAQGCRDAAIADLTTPDDTFGIVNTEKGFLFQSVGASTISSKIVKDENLSWEQMSEGKGRLLGCMLANGWGEYEMRELAKFFLNLDLHPIRAQSYGTQAVLRYQDRVRRNWVGRCRNGKPFAIGTINDTLLSNYQSQIGMEIQAKNNVSSFFASPVTLNTILTSFCTVPSHLIYGIIFEPHLIYGTVFAPHLIYGIIFAPHLLAPCTCSAPCNRFVPCSRSAPCTCSAPRNRFVPCSRSAPRTCFALRITTPSP